MTTKDNTVSIVCPQCKNSDPKKISAICGVYFCSKCDPQCIKPIQSKEQK